MPRYADYNPADSLTGVELVLLKQGTQTVRTTVDAIAARGTGGGTGGPTTSAGITHAYPGTGGVERTLESVLNDAAVNANGYGLATAANAAARIDALQKAFAAAAGKILYIPPGSYDLGAQSGYLALFVCGSTHPRLVLAYGVTFTFAPASNQLVAVFEINNNVNNLRVEGLTIVDSTTDIYAFGVYKGACLFHVWGGAGYNINRVGAVGCRQSGGAALIVADGSGNNYNLDNCYFHDCYVENAFYGVALDSGRGLRANFYAKSVRRSLFIQNMQDFDCTVAVRDAGSSNGNVMIKCLENRTTRGGRVRVVRDGTGVNAAGTVSPTVRVEVQASTTGGTKDNPIVEDVDLFLDDQADSALTDSLVFSAKDSSDAVETTTAKTVRNMRVSGRQSLPTNFLSSFSGNVFSDVEVRSGTSFTPDGRDGCTNFFYTLTGAAALNAPVNLQPGREYTFTFKQNATGGFALTPNAAYSFPIAAWSNTGNSANRYSVQKFVATTATAARQSAAQVAWAA